MTIGLVDHNQKSALTRYRRRYLNKKLDDLDESATRIIINHLLSDVLGYRELVDIKTEYPVKGGYIDYLIELNHKKVIVIEVKSIATKLTNKHLRQAVYYAATVGSDWIILTNARTLDLYKIRFSKPIKITKIFSLDLKRADSKLQSKVSFISKKSMARGANLSRLEYLLAKA